MRVIRVFIAVSLLSLVSGFSKPLHPVHVSFSNVEYMPDQNKYYVSVRLFAKDFTDVLEVKNEKRPNLKIKSSENDQTIDRYVQNNLKIRFNQDKSSIPLDFQYYVYLTEQEDVVQLFYTFEFKNEPQSVFISNTLLYDLYEDQKNLLIFNRKEFIKPLQFDISKPENEFTIN